ncbi:unnamed protein product [Caenorhabditis sp. 36 PRJEB53466]|nr:unnamed protein product [Caenorhabditis sp. 36 PRJEB53466]
MADSVYTTPQSVTGGRTPRRRALSPRPPRYSSPYQTIDLSKESNETLKTKLLEAETIIQDLRSERDTLQDQLVNTAGLNESVIIESSNVRSTRETRFYRRDLSVLEDDLKSKQCSIRDLQEQVTRVDIENQNLKEEIKRAEEDKLEMQQKFESLRERFHVLEEIQLDKMNDNAVLTNELQTKIQETNNQRTSYETKIAELEAKLSLLRARITMESREKKVQEEKVETLQRQIDRIQVEMMQKDELIKSSGESLAKEIRKSVDADRETENTRKVLSEVRQLSDRLECLTPVKKNPRLDKEREEFIQLSARVINETMSDLKTKNARLERELLEKKELVKATKDELDSLKETMAAAMGDSEQAARYLQNENLKLTRQKADIRCDLIETRRQLEGFETLKQGLEKQRDDALEEVRRITEQKKDIEKEIQSLVVLSARKDEQMEELQARMAGFEVLKREHEVVKAELARSLEKISQMGHHLVMADQQYSCLKAQKEEAERSSHRAKDNVGEMVVTIRGLKASLENQRKVEAELATLRAEYNRQQQKMDYMKEEIQAVHSDYRNDLALMAADKEKERRQDQSAEVSQLRLKLSKKENELKSALKKLEEVMADNRKIEEMLKKERAENHKTIEENVRARQGMADAVVKLEEYKRNWHNVQETCERLERENGEKESRMYKLEEELQEKTQQVSESEEVVTYLHSQINAKQSKQPKLGRRSTLLSTVSEMDTTVYIREAEEVQKLEEQRQELLRDLAAKKRQLAESKSHSTTNTTTITMGTSVQTSQSASQLSHPRQGTMRHDIPHKWKDLRHFGVLSTKCSLCFVGIPALAKAKKCTHCDVHVHASCAPRVSNTCGMPVQCANYYRENHTTVDCSGVSEGRMNGWLRVYRDDNPGSTWIASWAMMDLTRIAFYTNDGADLDKPFFSIDLNQEQWVLRTAQEMPVECDDSMRASNVLMIKMPRRSLYILAPSQPSACRWADCLQTAQRKRMMLNSRPSCMAENTCLLVLQEPNNLKIFKTLTIEDWYVFATQTGIFFTSISQPRNPLRIAGPNSVTAMEIMAEINCIAMVVNSSGQMALIPMDSLTLAMQSIQPSIRPEVLPEFGHVNTIRYHQQNGQRFMLIADDTHLHIRKYNATRDVFSHFAKLEVPEPVTFIESSPQGVLFASDTFYHVPFDHQSSTSARALMPARRSDYPISAHFIGGSEVLLCYQNYGVFVNLEGRQTRRETIEWEKMPLEFTFLAPYLYIVHDDSIEILEIAENTGADSKTVMAEREVFECPNAHITGRQYEGVLVSISSKEATEVHRFSATIKRNNITKRRRASPSDTLKRTKN